MDPCLAWSECAHGSAGAVEDKLQGVFTYKATTPRDGRRGPRGQHRAQQILQERALAEGMAAENPMAAEDASLAAAEAQLPAYL